MCQLFTRGCSRLATRYVLQSMLVYVKVFLCDDSFVAALDYIDWSVGPINEFWFKMVLTGRKISQIGAISELDAHWVRHPGIEFWVMRLLWRVSKLLLFLSYLNWPIECLYDGWLDPIDAKLTNCYFPFVLCMFCFDCWSVVEIPYTCLLI